MTKYRKALAAFLLPFLALPLADWVAGVTVDWSLVLSTLLTAAIAAFGVWRLPNAES